MKNEWREFETNVGTAGSVSVSLGTSNNIEGHDDSERGKLPVSTDG